MYSFCYITFVSLEWSALHVPIRITVYVYEPGCAPVVYYLNKQEGILHLVRHLKLLFSLPSGLIMQRIGRMCVQGNPLLSARLARNPILSENWRGAVLNYVRTNLYLGWVGAPLHPSTDRAV